MADTGRPSKYNPSFCQKVIDLGNEGASIDEMAFECGVHDDTLRNWAEEYQEFFDAFTRAKAASLVWWERKGRAGMEKPAQEFQGNIWSRNMSARFPDKWREVKGAEITGKDGGAIKQELDLSNLSSAALKELAALATNK